VIAHKLHTTAAVFHQLTVPHLDVTSSTPKQHVSGSRPFLYHELEVSLPIHKAFYNNVKVTSRTALATSTY
jgi:hypothetical protein